MGRGPARRSSGGHRLASCTPSAPSLEEALQALAVVWLLVASQPLLARCLGPSGATLSAFAGGLAWLWLTRSGTAPARGRHRRLHLLLGAAAGYAGLPAWCLLSTLVVLALGLAPGAPLPPGSAPAPLLPALLLVGPLLEELLYRERLLGALAPRVPAPVALLAGSAAFALPHAEPRLVVATFLVGLALGAVWLVTHSLALCVGLHAGLNLAIQVGGVPPSRAALPPAAAAACAVALLTLALPGRRAR